MDFTKLTFNEYINQYEDSKEKSQPLLSQLNSKEEIEEASKQADIFLALKWYTTKNENLINVLQEKARSNELEYQVGDTWSNNRNILTLNWLENGKHHTLDIPLYDRSKEELETIKKITQYLPAYDKTKEALSFLYEDRKTINLIEQWVEKGETDGNFPKKIEEGVLIPANMAVIQTINSLHHLQLDARLNEENSFRERDESLVSLSKEITNHAEKLKDRLGTAALRNNIISQEEYSEVMPIEQAAVRHGRL